MTLINQNSTVTHNGNGVTTTWPYTFIIPDEDSARVGLFDIASGALTEIPDTDYSITGINDDAGGEVEYPLVGSPISAAKRLVIWREVEYTQDTELTNQTPYYPVVLMAQLDRMVMQTQQLAAEIARAIKVTLGSNLTPDEFIADLQEGAAVATEQAGIATTQAEIAVAAAESIALPADPTPLYMLRRNAGDTAYEERSPAQVLADIDGAPYDEGTWTPVFTFATPGNLNVVYSVQNASYEKIGRQVRVSFQITTTTFTHTTAAGIAQITGLPFVSANAAPDAYQGAVAYSNIATARALVAEIQANSSAIVLTGSVSGVALNNMEVANFPTATNYTIRGTVVYRTE